MKTTKYDKYDMAFETIVDCITDCKLTKVGEINKALNRMGELVHGEYPMNVEYGYIEDGFYDRPSCPECGNELEDYDDDNPIKYCPYCGQRITYEVEEDEE